MLKDQVVMIKVGELFEMIEKAQQGNVLETKAFIFDRIMQSEGLELASPREVNSENTIRSMPLRPVPPMPSVLPKPSVPLEIEVEEELYEEEGEDEDFEETSNAAIEMLLNRHKGSGTSSLSDDAEEDLALENYEDEYEEEEEIPQRPPPREREAKSNKKSIHSTNDSITDRLKEIQQRSEILNAFSGLTTPVQAPPRKGRR